MSDNMKLWNAVEETDPATTKKVTFGRGFTAIDAYSQIKRATEEWGPYGGTWGLTSIEYEFMAHTPVVLVIGQFKMPEGSFPVSSSIIYYNEKKETYDDDFAKKVETDLITKALSRLGFNADIFMGKFDDNRYVAKMNEKFNGPDKEPADMEKVKKAVDFFKGEIDKDTIEDTFEIIQAAHKKLTNNEKLEVLSRLKMKAPDSNKMYSTLLTDHLNFKEADKGIDRK